MKKQHLVTLSKLIKALSKLEIRFIKLNNDLHKSCDDKQPKKRKGRKSKLKDA